MRRVLDGWQLPLPGPLALTAASGFDGIEPDGKLGVLLLDAQEQPLDFRICVSVPVKDYAAFVAALGGNDERVTTVRAAGVELLAGRRDNVAVLMDSTERETLESVLEHASKIFELAAPQDWASLQDLVLEIAAPGMQLLVRDHRKAPAAEQTNAAGADDLFAPVDVPADDELGTDEPGVGSLEAPGRDAANRGIQQIMEHLSRQFDENQLLASLADDVESIALGIRRSEHGEIAGELRVAWREDSPLYKMAAADLAALPQGFAKKPTVLYGGGVLPVPLLETLATAYVHQFVRAFNETELRNADVEQLTAAVLQLTRLINGLGIVQRPADEDVGVHTNQFILIHGDDASTVTAAVIDVVKAWNWLMDNADGEIMQLGSKSVQVRNRGAVLFDADMTAIFAPNPDSVALPEIRAAMEKLFGKDGYFRLLVVPLDKSNVLVAVATVEQTAELVADIEAAPAPVLVPGNPDRSGTVQYQVQLDLHQFSRQFYAIRHADRGDVLGEPPVRLFQPSPPITITLGIEPVSPAALRVLVAIPRDTVHAVGQYIKSRR